MFKILPSCITAWIERLQKLYSFSYLLSCRMFCLHIFFSAPFIYSLSLSFSFFKYRHKGFQDPYIFTLHRYDHINIYNRIYVKYAITVITYTHKHICTHAHTYASIIIVPIKFQSCTVRNILQSLAKYRYNNTTIDNVVVFQVKTFCISLHVYFILNAALSGEHKCDRL
jgi:hypothetical protein